MSLYTELVAAGVPVDSHESDLYVQADPTSFEILDAHPQQKAISAPFWNEVRHAVWIDVPFAYDPWWEKRAKKV